MADRISEHHRRYITRSALRGAYRYITDLLQQYDLPATFAFVMAFTLSPEEQRSAASLIIDRQVEGSNWLRHYRNAQREGDLDGWSCPEALDLVRERNRHEVACHGFTHFPLDERNATADVVREELAAALEVAKAKQIALRTLVYPRNRVGHVAVLKEFGFIGYRTAPPSSGRFIRQINLLREFNVLDGAQEALLPIDGICPIPSGYFLNWKCGLRRVIPLSITVKRWSAVLWDAAQNGQVAHMFLHPHNLIDGPATKRSFAAIVRLATDMRDAGKLRIITQEQYCQERLHWK